MNMYIIMNISFDYIKTPNEQNKIETIRNKRI